MFKKKCKHEGKMFPVHDNTGWQVGFLCDCGYFEPRKNIPCYDERMRQKIEQLKKRAI